MTDLLLPVLMLVLGLALGAVAAWLAGRPARAAAAERSALDARLREVELARARAEQQAGELPPMRLMVDALREERDEACRTLSALEAATAERERSFAALKAQIEADKETLSARFAEVGGKLLADAQRALLERADQRFAQAGEKSEAQLKALLAPVETTLKRYEEGLSKVEKERVDSYAELRSSVNQLVQGNDVVRKETARLANVLRSSPKARGRWGEEQLRTILEAAGLAENVDFSLQETVADGERQLRPDCVIHLPGGRCIVVDVKCPLVAFEQAFDEEDEERRQALLAAHAGALKSYAADLGRKGYWRQFDLSPEFVIMFVPGEHFLSAAAERAPDLIETAFRAQVIVASTINMLALAKVMAGMWRQETLATQAAEIGALGKELYARLATMGGHVEKLGRNLAQATGAYNSFVGSLEGQVLTQAKRFETLKVDGGGRTIEPLPMVEAGVRPLVKLRSDPGDGGGRDAGEAIAAE